MQILLDLARANRKNNPERSKKYVELSRKIGTRYNVRLSPEQKESFCKKCNSILISGETKQTRIDSKIKAVSIKCLNCNHVYRKRYR